jgi:hypothetical protein
MIEEKNAEKLTVIKALVRGMYGPVNGDCPSAEVCNSKGLKVTPWLGGDVPL